MYVCMYVSINYFKHGGTGYTAYIVCVVYHFLPLFLSVERANVKTDVLSRMSLKHENDLKKLWLRALSTPQSARRKSWNSLPLHLRKTGSLKDCKDRLKFYI